ncbi:MAG: DNA-binding response regulator [Rhodothermaceae bacterium]|nr:DNA-binding response regulator [Rhodothermaceae bacterium]MBC15088.1 DNA-binding response regulator [Rhodothermaceae bacterium]
MDRPGGLRVSLLPGGGPAVEAMVRAYLPSPFRLAVGPPGPDDDLAVVWWDGGASAGDRLPRTRVPLVALCAGGPDVLAAALDAGADHALALPISADLLRAVSRACTRRWPSDAPTATTERPSPVGPLHLDGRARTLTVHGRPVSLTLREFDLLSYLLRHAGAACSRDELLAGVWGIDFETGTNTVDVFVYALRRKLRAAGLPSAIETVRGVGYRLAPDLH